MYLYSVRIAITCVLLSVIGIHAYAQPSQVPMKKQNGYFFSGKESMLDDGVNCFVITEPKEFEALFGRNRSDTPHFHKEWMIVLVMPATKKDIQLDFTRISMKAGTFVEVYCDLNKLKGKQLTYEANPIAVCTIPRYDKVKEVNFYEERRKGLEIMKSVEIKQRRR